MKRTLQFAPCVLSDATDTDAEGRWKDSNRVRWNNGYPEKIGGWQPLVLATAADFEFRGICRALHDWSDLAGQVWVGLGTHKKLYIYSNGEFFDITPLRDTVLNLSDPIDTDSTGAFDPTGGSDASYFRVTDASHGADVGDIVNLAQVTAVGGITPAGDYEIREVVDANTYTLRHTSAATSTATGGGAGVDVLYDLGAGDESASVGDGFGLGTWGSGSFGTPRSGSSQISQPRVWSLVNWGEDLLASPLGGGLYVWDKSVGTGTRATVVSQAPAAINRILLSSEDRHLIAFGCTSSGGSFDPLLVRWCSQENYTVWTPATSNTAGSRRLDGGSRIITAINTGFGILIFTDKTLHLMQFIGPPGIFSIRLVAEGVSVIGPNAAIDAQGRVIWMGTSNFYRFNAGVVEVLPCEIWDKVFKDTQLMQGYQANVSLNEDFNEIRWEYVSATSPQNTRYVVYNYQENGWYGGTMERSAMHDKASIFNNKPYGTDTNGVGISDDNLSKFFVHESGSDDGDAPMYEFLESFDLHLPGIQEAIHMSAVFPDFKELEGAVDYTFRYKRRPQQQTYKEKFYPGITRTTERKGLRVRGHQIAWRIGSSELATAWRLGDNEFEYQEDGEG